MPLLNPSSGLNRSIKATAALFTLLADTSWGCVAWIDLNALSILFKHVIVLLFGFTFLFCVFADRVDLR